MKRFISLILAFVMCATLLAGCGSSGGSAATSAPTPAPAPAASATPAASGGIQGSYKLRFAHTGSTTDPIHLAAVWMAEQLKERSNGAVTMEIYPSAQLGDQAALTEMLMNGTVDFFGGSVVAIENYISAYKVVDLPYLVYDYDTADSLYGGEIGQEMLDMLPSIGIYGLGWCEFGFRNVYNNVRPIQTIDDFKGIKIRSIESSISIDMWTALGANPTVMGWSELYTGLQQGTVDGADGPNVLFASARMQEVTDYMSTTQHMYSPGMIQASKSAMDKLPAEVWALVQEVGAEASDYMKDQNRQAAADALKTMEDDGLQVNEVSNEVRAQMADRCADIYTKNRDVIGAEFYDKVMSFLGR